MTIKNKKSTGCAITLTTALFALTCSHAVLRNAIAGQNIVETITIEVASAPELPVVLSIPAAGGGTANIAFLTGTENANTPNAEVPKQQSAPANRIFAGVKSTFWIETVEHVILLPHSTRVSNRPARLGLDSPAATSVTVIQSISGWLLYANTREPPAVRVFEVMRCTPDHVHGST